MILTHQCNGRAGGWIGLPRLAERAGITRGQVGFLRETILGLIVMALCAGSQLQVAAAGTEEYQEYQVKAELLANFAAFVSWPDGTFPTTNSPVVIGVLGKDPFGLFLENVVTARGHSGRRLKLRRVSSDAELRECHILFVASSERRRLRDLKQKLMGAPVLTVGETDGFLDQGGIVNFVLKGQSVRFEISVESAKAAGLRLDAKLLSVADSVRGKYD